MVMYAMNFPLVLIRLGTRIVSINIQQKNLILQIITKTIISKIKSILLTKNKTENFGFPTAASKIVLSSKVNFSLYILACYSG